MVKKAADYKGFLRLQLDILEEIYNITVSQSQALDNGDDVLLGKLLKKRQKRIEKLASMGKYPDVLENIGKDEETLSLEESIQPLQAKICSANNNNTGKAERLKNEMGAALAKLKLGKRALQTGYCRTTPQRFGYFIDKKIGK